MYESNCVGERITTSEWSEAADFEGSYGQRPTAEKNVGVSYLTD